MESSTTSEAPGASTISRSPEPFSDAGGAPRPGETGQERMSIKQEARRKLADSLNGQKSAAADLVANLAEAVQRSGAQLQGRQDWIASAVGRGAEELDRVADSLRNRDLRDLASDLHGFAQRRPALFLGTAFAIGFGIARLGTMAQAERSRADLAIIPETRHAQY